MLRRFGLGGSGTAGASCATASSSAANETIDIRNLPQRVHASRSRAYRRRDAANILPPLPVHSTRGARVAPDSVLPAREADARVSRSAESSGEPCRATLKAELERGAAREAVQAPLQIDDRPVESCIDSPTRDSNPGDPSRFESHSGSQLLMNFRRTLLGVVSLLLACKSTDAGA